MIIAVDGNEANVSEKVGVSVYTLELLKHFQKNSSLERQFIVFLKSKPGYDLPQASEFYKYAVVPGNFLWSHTFLPLELYRRKALGQKIDLFFSPAHYIPRFCPLPTVVTVHDLSYFYYPEEFLKKDLYQLKNWTKYSVEKANKVIAVSQTTKKDIIKFYRIPEEKITVVYNGYQKKVVYTKQKKSGISSKYILYVGTLQPRKNITTLIDAFSDFRQKNPDFKLIIAGKKGWLYEHIFQKVKDLDLGNEVIFEGYVDSAQLAKLYRNAFCFVLPSLYEGFGIPLLEAMSYNCPVLSSYTSSLPEIGEDACLYFDPKNPQELTEKLLDLVANQKLRKELVKKGNERIKYFSWQKCAEETLEILTSK